LGRSNRGAESDDWAKQADATLKRIGGHDQVRSWLETNVGAVRLVQGKYEEAIEHNKRAVELKERAGASRGDIARSLQNIALGLAALGRPREAAQYMERSVGDLAKDLGTENPYFATYVSNWGEVLNSLGRYEEARDTFQRAIAVEERGYGKDSTNLAYPLQGLGICHLGRHEPAAAIAPLERALRIREARESDRALIAETCFALARALRETGRDQARERTLAERARDIYARQPEHRAELTEVERWMAQR
jgi:tetratricopeptide (TPR) repeat protein